MKRKLIQQIPKEHSNGFNLCPYNMVNKRGNVIQLASKGCIGCPFHEHVSSMYVYCSHPLDEE